MQPWSDTRATSFYQTENDTLNVGLVLSGGGALGIAHIGIIEAIEEAGLRIDYITGTSMGSLVGGLYSIGYTSEQLVNIVESNNFMELFTESRNRRNISNYERLIEGRTIVSFPISKSKIDLPLSILTGQNVYTFLSRLTWNVHGTESFDNFPIPFRAVGTDLETGEAVVFDSGYLPDALRASISIPSLFTPHEIDGKLLVDGGLVRNLPVQDAIEMGANYVIAVDVSSPLMLRDSLRSIASVLNQTVQFRIQDNVTKQKKLANYVIEVDELRPYNAADFDNPRGILNAGREAAKKHIESFKELASKQKRPPQPRSGVGDFGSLPINDVIISGNNIYNDEFILQQLEFTPGVSLNSTIIEEKVSKLYSSQYINNVTYRIVPDEDYYYIMYINIEENTMDEFKVGLRYETDTQASILLESNFQNLLHDGSISRLEARLGDRINFTADHVYYGALGSSFALLTSINYLSESVDWFSDNNRVSRFRNQIIRGDLSFGNYFSTQNLFSAGIRKDFIFHTEEINPDSINASSSDHHTIFARYIHDSKNRKSYATRGSKLLIEGFYSDDLLLSSINFTSASLIYEGLYPINSTLSIRNTVWAGYSTGRELPWGYWFSPNRYSMTQGETLFAGFDRYQIASRNVQAASIGIQLEPIYHRFLGVDLYTGRFMDNWNFNFNKNSIESGISLSAGAITIIGPVKVILSQRFKHNFRFELQIGHQF